MRKVILCPNPYRDKGFSGTKEALRILKGSGLETVVCLPFSDDGRFRDPELTMQPLQQELRSSDLVIAFGGDGTILHLAKAVALRGIPMLGVNLGSLGFISELEQNEMPRLRELAKWNFAIEGRMMLDVAVVRDGKQIYTNLALNEASVTKGAVAHVIKLHVSSDGQDLVEVRGDGIVLATPTGSTGYSLSAGGPVVEPTARNLLVSPICPISMRFNSYVLSPEHTLTVWPVESGRKPVYLSVDGGKAFLLKPGDVVRVRQSRYELKLVRLSGKSFSEIFEKKLLAGGQRDEK